MQRPQSGQQAGGLWKRIATENVGAEVKVLRSVQQLDTAAYMLDLLSEQFSLVLLVWFHNLEGPDFASEPVKSWSGFG
jgi:hypothetical protein